ncbi:MAG: ABC transporter substrate-binding protein [Pseudomonadota bacterium]
MAGLRPLLMPFLFAAALVSAEAQTKVVGVLTPLSGRHENLGKQLLEGAKAAIATHNLANPGNRVQLEFRDSKCEVDAALKEEAALRKAGAEILVGPMCNRPLIALLDRKASEILPTLVAFQRDKRLEDGRKKNGWPIYTLEPEAKAEPQAIVKFLLNRWSETPYAILDDGSVYGRGLADDIQGLAEARGQSPVALANFRPLQTSQAHVLRRLAKSGIKAIYVAGDAEDVSVFAKDAIRLGLELEVAGGEPLALLPFIDGLEQVPEGILAILQTQAVSLPKAEALIDRMAKAKIKVDGAFLRGMALTQIAIGTLNGGKVELSGKYDTVLGSIEFKQDGRADILPLELFVWRNGKFEPQSQLTQ